MTYKKRIAYNFRRLRKLKGWSQEQCAEEGGISKGYIGRIESAKGSFATEAQLKWAKVFNCDIGEFTAAEDNCIKHDTDEKESQWMAYYHRFQFLSPDKIAVIISTVEAVLSSMEKIRYKGTQRKA